MAGRARSFVGLVCALVVVAVLVAPAPASAAGPEFRGVQLHSLWEDNSSQDMDRELDLARGSGANVVRVDVGWSSLETGGKGQYSQWYLDKLDRLMEGANARGMRVIATLLYTPCWASSAPESLKQDCEGSWWERDVQMYSPERPSDYADAARFVTARYGTKLAALEVWNEPNLDEERFLVSLDGPRAYADMLKAAYPAVKQGNPDVDVLAGSLAYMNEGFLTRLYALGIQGSYDGLSIHPYNVSAPTAGNWSGIEWARRLQRAAGDDKPLWLTEFGWSTCSKGSGWCNSPEEQAINTKAAFQAIADDPQIKAAVVYNLRDKGTDPNSMEDNFGLVKRDFTPKPGYNALREALGGAGVERTASKPMRRLNVRLRLKIRRRGGSIIATVKAPRYRKVMVATSGCKHVPSRRLELRTGHQGRAVRRLGRASRLSGCRVTARMGELGPRAATSRVR